MNYRDKNWPNSEICIKQRGRSSYLNNGWITDGGFKNTIWRIHNTNYIPKQNWISLHIKTNLFFSHRKFGSLSSAHLKGRAILWGWHPSVTTYHHLTMNKTSCTQRTKKYLSVPYEPKDKNCKYILYFCHQELKQYKYTLNTIFLTKVCVWGDIVVYGLMFKPQQQQQQNHKTDSTEQSFDNFLFIIYTSRYKKMF